jgi:hypothetical protein
MVRSLPMILPLLASAWLAGCTTEEKPDLLRMEVLPYLVPCVIVIYPATCQVAREDGGDPGPLPGIIEGLDFEWGYRHHLDAEKLPYPPNVQDVPAYRYVAHGPAIRTLDTAWEFTTVLDDTANFTLYGDTLGFLGYRKPIWIPDAADRALVDSAGRERRVRITVRPLGRDLLIGSEAAAVRQPD